MTRTRPETGRRGTNAVLTALATVLLALPADADPIRAAALDAFARNCFSPHLTAETARAALAPHGRHDFYDLAPFSADAPSPATTAVTPGTDRRCALAFDGDHGAAAAGTAAAALKAQGIAREAPLPVSHAALEGTTLLGARYLNPSRIAVVHAGTRPGPDGPETFLSVERLTPEASAEATE